MQVWQVFLHADVFVVTQQQCWNTDRNSTQSGEISNLLPHPCLID